MAIPFIMAQKINRNPLRINKIRDDTIGNSQDECEMINNGNLSIYHWRDENIKVKRGKMPNEYQ